MVQIPLPCPVTSLEQKAHRNKGEQKSIYIPMINEPMIKEPMINERAGHIPQLSGQLAGLFRCLGVLGGFSSVKKYIIYSKSSRGPLATSPRSTGWAPML